MPGQHGPEIMVLAPKAVNAVFRRKNPFFPHRIFQANGQFSRNPATTKDRVSFQDQRL